MAKPLAQARGDDDAPITVPAMKRYAFEACVRARTEESYHDAFCEILLARHGATIADSTLVTLADRLAHARERFGTWTLAACFCHPRGLLQGR